MTNSDLKIGGNLMRKQKRIVVFDKEQYDGEWPPKSANEYVAWFSKKITEIPEEYRSSARIEIENVAGYDYGHSIRIEIYYDRPETDAEMNARESEERRRQEAQKAQELQTLAALKAKYGA